MKQDNRRLAGAAAWGAAGALFLAGSPASAQISVDVNGRPVQFGNVQPAKIGGRVLIPLRAVVESLGAEIKWDGSTQTVRGSKGERSFSLQINSRSATVNNNAVSLDVPAQLLSGTTMVPLRFVAEALGAEVEWNAATSRVAINSAVEAEPQPGRITGEVVAVRPDANPPTLTVTAGGVRNTYQIGRDTIILRGEEGRRGMPVDLDQIRPGDRVTLRADADTGRVDVVEATIPRGTQPPPTGMAVSGEVVAVRSDGVNRSVTVRTETGRETFTIPARTPVLRVVGTRPAAEVDLADVEVGDQVRLTLDAQGRAVSRLEATARAGNPPAAGEVTGEVVAIRETAPQSISVRTTEGRATYEVARDTVLLRKEENNRTSRVTLADIQPGDRVRIELDRTGMMARLVETTPLDLTPARDLRITSFTHSIRANETLRAGSQISVTLVGTPGAEASFDVGTLAKNVPLRETQAGRYTGTYTIPRGTTAKEVTLLGQLQKGTRAAPLIQAATAINIDSEAPKITDAAPADRAAVTSRQPDIYAEISDGDGSGIDPDSLQMTVAGRDVSRDVKLTNRFILYTPRTALPAGSVPVTLSVRDRAGNVAQSSWNFTVRETQALLQSVSHNADKALRAGDVLEVTAKGEPRGTAVFHLGDVARNVPMRETAAGTYVGRYTVRRGDQILKAPISVEFTGRDGGKARLEGTAPVNVVTLEPKAAVVTTPTRPFKLEDQLVVEGTAEPGSKVVVDVKYTGRAIGFLPVEGTFGSQEVTADRTGRWKTQPFGVRLPLGVRRPSLTITAVSVDAAGTRAKPTVVEVETR